MLGRTTQVKNRISIRGMATATAVVAASTAVTLGANTLVSDEPVVAEPAAISGPLPVAGHEQLPAKPSGATLTRLAEKERLEAARQRKAKEAKERAARAAREAREAQERASRSASRTPRFSGSVRGIAADMAAERYGWGAEQFSCLDALWERESGWNHRASNPSSGAYGIPQALPGSKMGAFGSDWQTNPVTQIEWGLDYIDGRYGSPCGAWNTFQSEGWY